MIFYRILLWIRQNTCIYNDILLVLDEQTLPVSDAAIKKSMSFNTRNMVREM